MRTLVPRSAVVCMLSAMFAVAGGPHPLGAQGIADLSTLSIEDLMKVEITTASRREQPAVDTAAAVFVITRDDIRRSGMRTVPDLLRLAPGVQVAQVNATRWAVSIRGFNDVHANKLLVMVDGRSVYNRLFSGVLWIEQDLMVDDIERIEVIRGPGGVMWGANAVNGVINIVTRSAAETRGGLVRVDAGGSGQQAAMRYGGRSGGVDYRVFAQATGFSDTRLGPDVAADDDAQLVTTGLRADWGTSAHAFTARAGLTGGRNKALWLNLDPTTAALDPVAREATDALAGHAFGQWNHQRPSGSTLQVRTTFEAASRDEPIGDYRRRLLDLETQFRAAPGPRHDMVVGGGYRFMSEALRGRFGFRLTPEHNHAYLLTAFGQDEIGFLNRRLTLTLGAQLQYDEDWGTGVQPTMRLLWKARPSHRVWGAWARARRTPSLVDRGVRLDYPPTPGPGGIPLAVTLTGNPDPRSERFGTLEAGYRFGGRVVSLDVTAYRGVYRDLTTREVDPPVFELVPAPLVRVSSHLGNGLGATVYGAEAAASWNPLTVWRLDASYSLYRLDPELGSDSLDLAAGSSDGSTPGEQWQLRSVTSVGTRGTLSAAFFRAGRLRQLDIPAYTRADLTFEWRLNRAFSVMAFGQNLLDASHPEFDATQALTVATQVPRTAGIRLRWTSP